MLVIQYSFPKPLLFSYKSIIYTFTILFKFHRILFIFTYLFIIIIILCLMIITRRLAWCFTEAKASTSVQTGFYFYILLDITSEFILQWITSFKLRDTQAFQNERRIYFSWTSSEILNFMVNENETVYYYKLCAGK